MLGWRKSNRAVQRPTILIVDDNASICETLRDRLAQCSWNVTTAANGQEALESAAQHRPNLVLLDVNMPVMDGHKTLASLRLDQALSTVPVIMVTASDKACDITQAASHGITDYVTKPFNPADLVRRIERALGETAS
jgi:CheY-like chemotaxis protein